MSADTKLPKFMSVEEKPMGLTITKRYFNLKAAHRQWKHKGHCAKIHGENWTFEITFEAKELDECGFVVDFGKLAPIRLWFNTVFDHVVLLDEDDPSLVLFRQLESSGLMRLSIVPSASAEGLASFVFREVDDMIRKLTEFRVKVVKVICFEDEKNSACVKI
jgi:6-pyruvoyltetrahydropterin/6-carboxytetrahydropterin synthase